MCVRKIVLCVDAYEKFIIWNCCYEWQVKISNVHIRLEEELLSDNQSDFRAYAVLFRHMVLKNPKKITADQQKQVHQQFGIRGLSMYARLRATVVDCASTATVTEAMKPNFKSKDSLRGTILAPVKFDLKARYTRKDDVQNNFRCQLEFAVSKRQNEKQGIDLR